MKLGLITVRGERNLVMKEKNEENNVGSLPNIIGAASRNRSVVVRVEYMGVSKRSGLGVR